VSNFAGLFSRFQEASASCLRNAKMLFKYGRHIHVTVNAIAALYLNKKPKDGSTKKIFQVLSIICLYISMFNNRE